MRRGPAEPLWALPSSRPRCTTRPVSTRLEVAVPAVDVALALMALDKQRVHWEVSHDDFSSLEGLDLRGEERRRVIEATRGVVTRDEKVSVAFRPEEAPDDMTGPGGPERGFGYWPRGMAEAIRYAQEGLDDPRLQASFVAW